MIIKQLQATVEQIGDMKFYITPFPALKAANISAELASVLTPVLGALAPLAVSDNDMMDMDVSMAAGAISNLSLDGDNFEKLIRKLLLGGNISVEIEDDAGKISQHRLDADLLNEIFCGEVQDMFALCFYVIRLNFKGFFRKFNALSGKAQALAGLLKTQKNTEPLTTDSSGNSNSDATS